MSERQKRQASVETLTAYREDVRTQIAVLQEVDSALTVAIGAAEEAPKETITAKVFIPWPGIQVPSGWSIPIRCTECGSDFPSGWTGPTTSNWKGCPVCFARFGEIEREPSGEERRQREIKEDLSEMVIGKMTNFVMKYEA